MKIVAINQWGFRAQFNDNPHLEDPRVRFIEEKFVEYEREFGEEGDEAAAGFANNFEKWLKANSKRGPMGDCLMMTELTLSGGS
jgi:hypothetical protein